MSIDLFACVPVSDYETALAWYERLLGTPPSFVPNDVEAVWELAEHRFLYVEHVPARAGHAIVTIFRNDFDAYTLGLAERGLEPATRETYDNGVRKWIYRDPDGNEIGFGGAPDGE